SLIHTCSIHIYPPTTSTLSPYTTLFRSYKQRHILKENFWTIIITVVAAMVTAVVSVLIVAVIFNMDEEILRSVLSKSETTAIAIDRKSTRLNSSHVSISYAVFCLKKKNS